MNSRISMTALGVLVVSAALAGCNKADQDAAKDSADRSVAQVDQKARQLGNETKDAAQKVGDKIDDAVITASVKTEIAKDSDLSALKINVDTSDGKVALRGTAPSNLAKEHATTIAAGVKGVSTVDNQLSVAPAK
ncbi:MAG: BON domain-containing protein [Burkholderiales bacterium]